MQDWIRSFFPPHDIFIDCMGGGGSIILNKLPVFTNVYNDLGSISKVFKDIQNGRLIDEIKSIEYTQDNFDRAINQVIYQIDSGFSPALAILIKYRMSRAGIGKHFSWSSRKRGNLPGDANAWNNFKEQLPEIHHRLQCITIRNNDYKVLLNEYNSPECLIYLDPPYLHSERTTTNVYELEWSAINHCDMCDLVNQSKSKIIISGYDNDIYAQSLRNWNKVEKSIVNHASQSKQKQKKTECLWVNY